MMQVPLKLLKKRLQQYEKLNDIIVKGISSAIKKETAEIVEKMRSTRHRWMIPDIVVFMTILVNSLLMLFTALVLVANYYVLHEFYIWKIAMVIGGGGGIAIGISLYVYYHFFDR